MISVNNQEKIGWLLIFLIFFASMTGVLFVAFKGQRAWIKAESSAFDTRVITELKTSFSGLKVSLDKIGDAQTEMARASVRLLPSPPPQEMQSSECDTQLQSFTKMLLLVIEMRELFTQNLSFSNQLQQLKSELMQYCDFEDFEFLVSKMDYQNEHGVYGFSDLKNEFATIIASSKLNNRNEAEKILANWVTISAKDSALYKMQMYVDAEQWTEVLDVMQNIQHGDLQDWAKKLRKMISIRESMEEIYRKFLKFIKERLSQNIY